LWDLLFAAIPGLALNGHATERLPGTLNVRFPNVSGVDLLARAHDVAASTGSACHADSERASGVLLEMGVNPEEALGAVRLSLGRQTNRDDVDRSAASLIAAWRGVLIN
jgi:cysteine desulfurase